MIVVVLETGDRRYHYGRFPNRELAQRFADFLTAEIDPAHVADTSDPPPPLGSPLRSPLAEMLAWYREHQNEELDQHRAEESS